MYLGLKHSHILIAIISFVLFEFRYIFYHMRSKPMPKILRVLPHIIDTVLLASGITLIVLVGYNPLNTPWLLLKIILVFVYIALGVVALRSTGGRSTLAFILATLTIAYIFSLAFLKNPLFFMP